MLSGRPRALPTTRTSRLEEELQRLYQCKLQILRQAAHVVVGLDGATLQDVRVDGSLGQEFNPRQLPGFLLKDPDELCADDLPFGLRVGHPGQLVQETVHCVYIDQVGIHLVAEHLDHLFRFSLPQETVVYVDAGELLTHRLDQQGRLPPTSPPRRTGPAGPFCPPICF